MKGRYLKSTTLGFTTKRVGVLAIVVLAAVVLAVFGLHGHQPDAIPHNSKVPKSPVMSTMAGGSNHSHTLDAMAASQDATASRDAAAKGQSYTASLSGQTPPSELGMASTPTSNGQLPVVNAAQPKPPPAPANPVSNPFNSSAPAPQAAQHDGDRTPAPSPHGQLPEEVALELVQAWTPQPPLVERMTAGVGSGNGRGQGSQGGSSGGAAASADSAKHTNTETSTLAAKAAKTLLLEEGHGVFARNVLAVSSDSNGPVIVEIESGPFVGARMTGSFERKEDRLVVKFQSLAIGDADPIPVDAIAVAPDTMETAVASHVDEHYLTRVVLPTAAAFVQGLGQAFAQSNSTSVLSPLGGTTSTTKLNFGQEIGVAAGAAGQQVGQILQKAAPSGPTVTLDKDVSLGVVFLKPVYANS